MKLTKEELKQLQKDWEIFLHQNEMSDVLTDDTWNEDYAHHVTLTVREKQCNQSNTKKWTKTNTKL